MTETDTTGRDPALLAARLAQAERDEEWALVRVGGWAVLLLFIVVVLFLSPWPWGALVGLAFWALGARGVYSSFSAATERTRRLRAEAERSNGASEPSG
jgi:hypothetical protein